MKQINTPSPWVVSFNGTDDIRIFSESVADSPKCVCKVNVALNRSLEATSNARLIAAAPDLLDAARQALYALSGCSIGMEKLADHLPKKVELLRRAIDRAEGRA
jgi:hypothetical protein